MSVEKPKLSSSGDLFLQSKSQRFSSIEDYIFRVRHCETSSAKRMNSKRKLCHEETPPTKRRRVGESGVEEGAEDPSLIERRHGDSSASQRKFLESKTSCSTRSSSSTTSSSSSRSTTSSSSSSRSTTSSSSSSSTTSSSSSLSDSSSQEFLAAERNEGVTKSTLARQISDENLMASFNAKYRQQNPLQAGGFGQVFAGLRRRDGFPVAIKYISAENVKYEQMDQSGNKVPMEVEIMLLLSAQRDGSEAASAPVALLDYYELKDQLILVMERPDPCVDLMDYVLGRKDSLTEEEAQVILKQTVAALLVLERRCVFHRDIKMENILIEERGDLPRVRIIDFGLSTIAGRESTFTIFCGTPCHTPPECQHCGIHAAGPTTVWQLGALAYELLHEKTRFETRQFMAKKLKICRTLSHDCQEFLSKCLAGTPEQRSTLPELLELRWMK